MSDLPAPPQLSNRGRRHSAKTMMLARRMYQGQWSVRQIVLYLDTLATPVTENTIRRWVIPGWGDHYRRNDLINQRRRRQQGLEPLTPDDRMLELRELGLSFSAIAKLLRHEFDIEITDEQVRHRYRKATR